MKEDDRGYLAWINSLEPAAVREWALAQYQVDLEQKIDVGFLEWIYYLEPAGYCDAALARYNADMAFKRHQYIERVSVT